MRWQRQMYGSGLRSGEWGDVFDGMGGFIGRGRLSCCGTSISASCVKWYFFLGCPVGTFPWDAPSILCHPNGLLELGSWVEHARQPRNNLNFCVVAY
jgi:hypothetical protein